MKRHFLLVLAATTLALTPGCQTLTQPTSESALTFPDPAPEWESRVGQLRYVTPERSVIGEIVISHHKESDFQLDFLTGPGVPLMRLRETGDTVLAEGLFARGRWEGKTSRPPGRLSGWIALREVFHALDRPSARHLTARSPKGATTPWSASAEYSNRKLERLSVTFPKSKDRFIFVFPQ